MNFKYMSRKSAFEIGQMDPILRVIKNALAIGSCRMTSQNEVVDLQQSTCTDHIVIPQSLGPVVGLQRLVRRLSYKFNVTFV